MSIRHTSSSSAAQQLIISLHSRPIKFDRNRIRTANSTQNGSGSISFGRRRVSDAWSDANSRRPSVGDRKNEETVRRGAAASIGASRSRCRVVAVRLHSVCTDQFIFQIVSWTVGRRWRSLERPPGTDEGVLRSMFDAIVLHVRIKPNST